jgi:hypothetical protein
VRRITGLTLLERAERAERITEQDSALAWALYRAGLRRPPIAAPSRRAEQKETT